jgi:predicted PurR-regulated permease PerM
MDGRPPLIPPKILRTSGAIRVLAMIATGTVLYLARSAFVPIAISLLLSLILTTPVEALYRRGLTRSLSAVLIFVAFVAVIGVSVNLMWTPAQKWWDSAPQTLRTIEKKVRPISVLVNRIAALGDRASSLTAPRATAVTPAAASTPSAPATPPASPGISQVIPPQPNMAVELLEQTRAALVSIVTVALLTLFLMAGGPPMFARMSAALASDLRSTHILEMIDAVRSEVSRYYGSIFLINLGLGLATAAMTWLLDMPNPLMWGVVAGLLNFVPYAGSTTTLLLLTITAFMTFDTVGPVAAVAGGYLALATIEGQIVQPLVVGRRLQLNPIIVFLSLWFSGWFWGIAGIIMAIPSLVTLKVVAERSKRGNALAEFLSADRANELRYMTAGQRGGRRKNRR